MITQEDINEMYEYWEPTEDTSSYPTPQEMVTSYHKTAGLAVGIPLEEASADLLQLRWNLIEEEFNELSEELEVPQSVPNSPEILKEMADLVYVLYGMAVSYGWNLDEAVYRVHSNNMGRMKQPDGSIKRREDGKIIKNPEYPKVDLKDLV